MLTPLQATLITMSPLNAFLNNKSHISVQFIKYDLAGALASGTCILMFAVLNETVLPVDIHQSGAQRGWNFFISNMIAFLLGTLVAYLSNRAWVFQEIVPAA